MNSKQAVRKALSSSQPSLLPIILHFGAYAAKLGQVSYRQMAGDPTLLASSLQSAQRLFGGDGLVVLMDATMEAEALGCEIAWVDDEPTVKSHPLEGGQYLERLPESESIATTGRAAVALEAARRLNIVVGREVALFGAVTGPATLAFNLRGPAFQEDLAEAPEMAHRLVEFAIRAILSLARSYLELGLDGIVVADPLLAEIDARYLGSIDAALRPLWNVVDFFDAHSILVTRSAARRNAQELLSLGAGALGFEDDGQLDSVPPDSMVQLVRQRNKCLAIGLDDRILCGPLPDLERAVLECKDRSNAAGRSVFALWQIPRTTPADNLHAITRLLRG